MAPCNDYIRLLLFTVYLSFLNYLCVIFLIFVISTVLSSYVVLWPIAVIIAGYLYSLLFIYHSLRVC